MSALKHVQCRGQEKTQSQWPEYAVKAAESARLVVLLSALELVGHKHKDHGGARVRGALSRLACEGYCGSCDMSLL